MNDVINGFLLLLYRLKIRDREMKRDSERSKRKMRIILPLFEKKML
jgi:hypothetical protein